MIYIKILLLLSQIKSDLWFDSEFYLSSCNWTIYQIFLKQTLYELICFLEVKSQQEHNKYLDENIHSWSLVASSYMWITSVKLVWYFISVYCGFRLSWSNCSNHKQTIKSPINIIFMPADQYFSNSVSLNRVAVLWKTKIYFSMVNMNIIITICAYILNILTYFY